MEAAEVLAEVTVGIFNVYFIRSFDWNRTEFVKFYSFASLRILGLLRWNPCSGMSEKQSIYLSQTIFDLSCCDDRMRVIQLSEIMNMKRNSSKFLELENLTFRFFLLTKNHRCATRFFRNKLHNVYVLVFSDVFCF